MKTIAALRDQRRVSARAMRDLLDKNPGAMWNTARQREYDAQLGELDVLDAEIYRLETVRDRDTDMRISDAMATARRERRGGSDSIFDTYLRKGEQGLDAEQRAYIRNTMSTTTGSQGGFSVTSDVAKRFVDVLKDYSGVRRVAEVIVTEKGNVMPFPTSDGTSEVGELLAENASVSSLDPSFGTAPLTCWKYGSKVFTVPFELLYDSNIDIEGYVFSRAAARIGRLTNTHFTVGTGTAQPQGFSGVAGSGKIGTTGQTTSLIHDDLIDLIHSVNTAYRQTSQGLAFQMADVTFKFIRKIKDATTNRPVYLPSDGVQPETLLGYPVIVNDDVAVMAANAKSVFFGNWYMGYKIRDALEVQLFRFTDSVYSKLGQVGFLALARSGGNLVDTTAVKAYVNSAT
jgi:HK97 family phage major capsid protein